MRSKMELPHLHTVTPVTQDISMEDDHPHAASTDNTNVGRTRRTGRHRRARKHAGRELSPSSASWQAWRQEHQGELEAVLKEHPGAYELFRQAVKTVPETLEGWLQSRVSWHSWVEWREQHQGPLHEVLADPEGWALFCQMRAQKNNPVNMSYEEWLLLPEQQQLIRSVQWAAWRREHPGPQILALMLAAESPGGVEEGWEIYRSLRELKGENVPQTFQEWKALPDIRRKAALSAWALWRQNHEGRLQDVLDDPEGWKLYSEMLALNPSGARSRSSRNRLGHEQNQGVGNEENREAVAGGKGSIAREARRKWMDWRSKNRGPLVHILKDPDGWAAYRAINDGPRRYSEMPTTYEEWVERPEQQLTLATLAWTAWREQHQGKLPVVLADPEGWTLFRNLNTKSLIVAGRTAHTADRNVVKLKTNRKGVDKAKRSRRKTTPSTFATAAATPVTTATTTTTSAVLAGDDGNDDVELKGGSSTADEEQQQAGNTAAEESTCVLSFPESYEDWLRWRREKSRRSAVRGSEIGDDDGLAAHKNLEKRWQQWRVEHPGPLEEVLAAEPEGWAIYSAYMCRNGQKAYFTDFNSWLEVQVARRAWPKWREQHTGALAVALRNNPEGWPLYRAHVAGLSTASAAVHGNERQKPPLPETLQEWLQLPAQIVQITADAWNVWRQAHPGPLLPQLTKQVAVGQEEPCGWLLLRVLLQFYVCAAGTSIESGKRSVTDTEQVHALPDTLEAFVLDLKRSSRTAWLQWAQQQRRSSLQVRLRDPVGWALYKVMRESDGAAPEFAISYADWMQKRAEKVRAVAGHGNNSAASSGTAGSHTVSQGAGRVNTNSAGRQGGTEFNAVSAWSRWRRQRRGELLTVLQEHTRGWQLYCNMLAARNKPVPESFAAFKESRERDQREMQAEAAAQWELWRQQHAGPLEDVLADRHGAALYRKMIETNNRSETIGNNNVKRSTTKKTEKAAQWLLWREQHPGPLEVVLAEHPEAVELHCAWLAAESRATGPGGGANPRGRGGRGTHSEKEAVRRWRQWRMQHPGPLQQVLAADLAAAAERGQTEVALVGEQGVRMTVDEQQQQQHLQAEGGGLTGWQLFCAHAASHGRKMPQNFQEWLQQPQQIAQREFGIWRAAHPGLLVDVLRDQEGWQLYVRMKRAAAAAATEEGVEPPEVVEDYNDWVERERLQREQQSKRRNRRMKADDRQGGTEGLAEQTYHCGGSATGDRLVVQSAEGCHGAGGSVFGSAPGPA